MCFACAGWLGACGTGPTLPAPSAVTAPAPGPTPAPGATISGIVRDGFDGMPLPEVTVSINSGQRTVTDGAGRFSTFVSVNTDSGTPYLGFGKTGFYGAGNTVFIGGGLTVDLILARLCTVLPTQVTVAEVGPGYVDFDWRPSRPVAVTSWILEIGSSTTANAAIVDPLGRLAAPNVLSQDMGASTSWRWQPRPLDSGRYWVRLRTKNNCGLSSATDYTRFTVPG
jgi:hypothetical protein